MLLIILNKSKHQPEQLEDRLAHAIQIAREGLTEVRSSVSGLISETDIGKNDLLGLLKRIAKDFQATGVTVGIAYDDSLPGLSPVLTYQIYRVCKESLTNSLRHGEATRIDIIIKRIEQGIRIHILDNGKGCREIKPGNGLNGLKQRVTETGGRIFFYSDGEQGFTVKLEYDLS